MSQPVVIAPPGLFSAKRDNDLFRSLVIRPILSFATQDADEKIYVLARRHVITNVGWIVRLTIGLLALPILALVLPKIGVNFTDILPARYIPLVPLFYYAPWFTYALIKYSDWYFNVLIITNKRLLDVDYTPFTGRKLAETNLSKIEDVSQHKIGFLPEIFNYGDLLVQTAANKNKFSFNYLPRPDWFRNVLVDLVNTGNNPEP